MRDQNGHILHDYGILGHKLISPPIDNRIS